MKYMLLFFLATCVVGEDYGSKSLEELDAMEIYVYCGERAIAEPVQSSPTSDLYDLEYNLIAAHYYNNDPIIPIYDPKKLLQHPHFNTNNPTVIMISGWAPPEDFQEIYKASVYSGEFNFVLVDTAIYLQTLEDWAEFDIENAGTAIGESLADMIEEYPIENIKLVGHSIGAHIAGVAGRYLTKKTGKILPRITGLDPTRQCLNWGDKMPYLKRGDAEFVMVIHTNPGGFGHKSIVGDADFFPNGYFPLQPGCSTSICSHHRSIEYYAESVYPGREKNFIATRCSSKEALKNNMCSENRQVPMGHDTPSTTQGIYFLTTKRESPFGENNYFK